MHASGLAFFPFASCSLFSFCASRSCSFLCFSFSLSNRFSRCSLVSFFFFFEDFFFFFFPCAILVSINPTQPVSIYKGWQYWYVQLHVFNFDLSSYTYANWITQIYDTAGIFSINLEQLKCKQPPNWMKQALTLLHFGCVS